MGFEDSHVYWLITLKIAKRSGWNSNLGCQSPTSVPLITVHHCICDRMCLLYKVITHKRSLDWKCKFRDGTRWAWKCLWPERSPWAWEGSRRVQETWFFCTVPTASSCFPTRPRTQMWPWEGQNKEYPRSQSQTPCTHQWLCSYLYTSHNLQITGQKYPYFSHTELSFLLFEAKKKKCLFRGNRGKCFKKGVLTVLDVLERGIIILKCLMIQI